MAAVVVCLGDVQPNDQVGLASQRDDVARAALRDWLRGHLDGLHSIRVNKRWRLVFRWDSGRGEAKDLYLDDHSYE